MPEQTTFQVGDWINVVAGDFDLDDIHIPSDDAENIRSLSPHRINQVIRGRLYISYRGERWYVLPSHVERAAAPVLIGHVSRRPPQNVRKATAEPLPLP